MWQQFLLKVLLLKLTYPTHITVIIALSPRQVLLRIIDSGKSSLDTMKCSNVLETSPDFRAKSMVLTPLSPASLSGKQQKLLCILVSSFVYRENNIGCTLIQIVISSEIMCIKGTKYFDVGKYDLSEQYQVLIWIYSLPTEFL